MSQAQKLGEERDEGVWSFHNIWGSGVDASRCGDESGSSGVHAQWFSCWNIRADDHDIV